MIKASNKEERDMDEKQNLQELLERLDASNRKQANYAKWQCIFSVAAAVSCAERSAGYLL